MANRQQKRLSKEMSDLNAQPIEGVKIDLINDQITNWNVHIKGPANSPYEKGTFTVNIDFSDNYPFKCPKVQFVTKIYHPNVKTDTGEICAQAIQQSWVPTLNVQFIIKMLMELIENPNTENPMEAEISGLLMLNPSKFKENAKEYTEKYAM